MMLLNQITATTSAVVAAASTRRLLTPSSLSTKKRYLISKRSFRSSISLLDHSSSSTSRRDMSPNTSGSSTSRRLDPTSVQNSLNRTTKRQQHFKSALAAQDASASIVSSAADSTSSTIINFEPTLNNKFKLPKQPLPELSASLGRYMNSVRPFSVVDPNGREKLKHTEDCVRRFLDPASVNNGHVLQDMLYERAEARDNWALEKSLDMFLMDTENPVPIYMSPAQVMKPRKFEDENDFLTYATRLMKGIHSFKVKIDTDTLEVERANAYDKGQPLCMEQYKSIFSSYRVPGFERDCFRVYNDDLVNQFVVVMSRGQLFKVDLVTNSSLVSDLEIFHQLKEIRRVSAATERPQLDLGYLTSLPRRDWCAVRQSLLKDPVNARSLDLIERCSFMICLDEKVDSSDEFVAGEDTKNGMQILHGSGVQFNSRNRWFDKSLQFVVSEDGVNGLIREHTPSEGPITVNLINHVYKYLNSAKHFDSSETYPFSEPERLEWSLSDEHVEHVHKARQVFAQAIDNFDMSVFKYEKYGRSYPKLFNMSPDSFMQVVYQLAYFRMYGRLSTQMSFGSMRRFFRGRADYVRSSSMDVLRFCLAMNSPSASMSERFYLFDKAVETQTNTMVETILGHGYDAHLITLKKMALEMNGKLPDVFEDPMYKFNSNFEVATSQMTTKDDGTFSCISPMSKIGYGSSYNLKPDQILFMMSSYKNARDNSIACFSDSIVDSLDLVYEICQHRFKSTSVHSSSNSNSNKRK